MVVACQLDIYLNTKRFRLCSTVSTKHLVKLGISSPERRISHFHPNRNNESYAAVFCESPRDLAFSSPHSFQKARIQTPLYGLKEAYKRYHLVHPARIIHYRYLLKCEDVFQTFSELIERFGAVYQCLSLDTLFAHKLIANYVVNFLFNAEQDTYLKIK